MDHVPDVFRLVHIEIIPIDDLLKCLYAHGQPLQFVLIHAGFFCVSCLFTCKATLLFRNAQGMQREKKGKNRRRGKQAVFATQLGSKFFPVGASIRSISLAAGFILSSEAVFTCDSPHSGNYGIIPYISVPPFTPNVPYGFLMAVESRYVYIHYSLHQECFFDYLKAETDITLLRIGLITLRPKD